MLLKYFIFLGLLLLSSTALGESENDSKEILPSEISDNFYITINSKTLYYIVAIPIAVKYYEYLVNQYASSGLFYRGIFYSSLSMTMMLFAHLFAQKIFNDSIFIENIFKDLLISSVVAHQYVLSIILFKIYSDPRYSSLLSNPIEGECLRQMMFIQFLTNIVKFMIVHNYKNIIENNLNNSLDKSSYFPINVSFDFFLSAWEVINAFNIDMLYATSMNNR